MKNWFIKKETGMSKILMIVIIGVALIGLFFLLNMTSDQGIFKNNYTKSEVPILSDLDLNKLEIISDNPDFIYTHDNFEPPNAAESYYPMYLMDGSGSIPSNFWLPWYGNGVYMNYPLPIGSNNDGSIFLHPKDISTPRFIVQDISLPNEDNIVLVARITNIAEYVDAACDGCSDAIIKIKIIDRATNVEETIYEGFVDSQKGWENVALNISKFAGKGITFRIEGHAGGPCSDWCAEWAAVDKFYIATLE